MMMVVKTVPPTLKIRKQFGEVKKHVLTDFDTE